MPLRAAFWGNFSGRNVFLLEGPGWHVPERSEGRGCSWLPFATNAKPEDRALSWTKGGTNELRHALPYGQGRATLDLPLGILNC
jgi:hypothetical protein